MNNSTDYLKGVEDCASGVECPKNPPSEYFKGYSDQYQSEQIETARTGQKD